MNELNGERVVGSRDMEDRDRGDILFSMLGGHRSGLCLLVPEESRSELCGRLIKGAAHRAMLDEIAREAKRLLKEPEPQLPFSLFHMYEASGERLPYERAYFTKRRRLNSFAIMALLHPEDETYQQALYDTIWSICSEATWCLPAHAGGLGSRQEPIDLFAAETGFALSELSALLSEQLPDMLRSRMAQEVERRLLLPFMEQGPYGWERVEHNWAAVCAGSIGAAALYSTWEKERQAALLERVLASLDCFLSGYGEDGACAEGYSYWQYGFGYYVYFAALLKEATSGALNLLVNDKVKQIALFQQKIFTSGRMIVSFSDCLSESGIFMGLSSYLHEQYSEFIMPDWTLRADYTEDHCARWAPAIRNLLWEKESVAAAGTAGAELEIQANAEAGRSGLGDSRDVGHLSAPVGRGWPAASYYLADVQWLHTRAIADDATYSFAAKGGCNDEPHNHNDVGHFVLHAYGEAYLADLGSGEYTAKYFGAERYSLWCNGAQGHSVPIIGGAYQQQGSEFRARVAELIQSEERDLLVLELQEAYPNSELTNLQRQFVVRKGAEGISLELTDTFCFSGKGELVTERFITLPEPIAVKPGEVLVMGKRCLRIDYNEALWTPLIRQRSEPDHFGKERSFYTLDFEQIGGVKRQLEAKFQFQFCEKDCLHRNKQNKDPSRSADSRLMSRADG